LRACDETGDEGVVIQVGGIRAERTARYTGRGQRPEDIRGGRRGVGWEAAALSMKGLP